MTVLNIQSLVFFGDGVIIWQVFIRMLGYYGAKAVGSIVKKLCKTQVTDGTATSSLNNLQSSCNTQCVGWSGTLPLSLCDREQLCERSELTNAGEGLIRGPEARKARGQAYLEVRKVRRSEGRLFTVKSLSSYPPTLISSDNPLPQSLPQWREAEKRASLLTLHTSLKKQAAFTLAEVLITLGIIGVVAAMTMPVLIQNQQKITTESKVKKFYSVINQAVKMSEAENGSYEFWDYPEKDNTEDTKAFFNKYFAKYMNILKITDRSTPINDSNGNPTELSANTIVIYLSDGSGFTMRSSDGIDILFYPSASKIGNYKKRSREVFMFNFNKQYASETKGFVEPFTYKWDGTKEDLINNTQYGCNKTSSNYAYCTKLLQLNNWKITKDYPW